MNAMLNNLSPDYHRHQQHHYNNGI